MTNPDVDRLVRQRLSGAVLKVAGKGVGLADGRGGVAAGEGQLGGSLVPRGRSKCLYADVSVGIVIRNVLPRSTLVNQLPSSV